MLSLNNAFCSFIGYGEDDFGYRCYDPIEKKLIRSLHVVFIEDQTIENIAKVERLTSFSDGYLINVNPTPMEDGNIHVGASQPKKEHEDVGEPMIVDDRVDTSYDVVLPETSIEQGKQLPLQEVANQPIRRSTGE